MTDNINFNLKMPDGMGVDIIENPVLPKGTMTIMREERKIYVQDYYNLIFRLWGVTDVGLDTAFHIAQKRVNAVINRPREITLDFIINAAIDDGIKHKPK